MAMLLQGPNAKICVALKFDDAGAAAVAAANKLCRRTGAALHLVHICENILTSEMAAIASSGLAAVPANYLDVAQTEIIESAKAQMKEFVKKVEPGVKYTQSVLGGAPGTPAELVEADAIANSCSMIMVRASQGSHRFVPKGFSCALSLMSHSRLPVLVTTGQQSMDLGAERLSIVVADDMKSHSTVAVVKGCEFAMALQRADIHHVHINGVSAETLRTALESAMAASFSRARPSLSADELYEITIQRLTAHLESRTVAMNVALELASCRYKASVVTARSACDGLEAFAKQNNANFMVFGRHQTFYKRPFDIGQMPNYAMLSLHCPILVIPAEQR